MDIVLDSLTIHPSLLVEFLIVFGGVVELRPYTNHEASVHSVNRVEHSLWVGITACFKVVSTPIGQIPVVPVLHDIVDRNVATTELCEVILDVLTALIAFAALPEAEHPFRIERCFSCQSAIAADDIIEILTCNEVVIHIARHLAPDAELLTLCLIARL